MKKLLKLVSTGIVSASVLVMPVAGFASPFGDDVSRSSVSIRTHKWMDAENYYLGVILDGVKPEHLLVSPRGRSLSLRVHREQRTQSDGGMSMSMGSANVSTSLPADADIQNIRKVVTGRDLVIVIPRRR